jgi:hypothetical protein
MVMFSVDEITFYESGIDSAIRRPLDRRDAPGALDPATGFFLLYTSQTPVKRWIPSGLCSVGGPGIKAVPLTITDYSEPDAIMAAQPEESIVVGNCPRQAAWRNFDPADLVVLENLE